MLKLLLVTVFTATLLNSSLEHGKESTKERIKKLKQVHFTHSSTITKAHGCCGKCLQHLISMLKLLLVTVFTATLLNSSLEHGKESTKERIKKLKQVHFTHSSTITKAHGCCGKCLQHLISMLKLLLVTVFTATLLNSSLEHGKESTKERIKKLKQKITEAQDKRYEEEMERSKQQREEKHHHKHFNKHGDIDSSLLNPEHEMDHIKSHLDVSLDPSKMTKDEFVFHFFSMHDDDKNGKLDGSELIKTLIHEHGEKENLIFSDDELELMVEKTLEKADQDQDGTMSWAEFKFLDGYIDLDE